MKLKDIRPDSWHMILRTIKKGQHPSKDDLAAALRRGESVPEVQAYLADLLEGRLDRRGRPKKFTKKWSGGKLLWLLMQMDDLVEHHKTRRADKPVQKALDDLGSKYNLDPDTVNLYLKQARKLMEIPDAALALEVNEERQRLQEQGVANPLNSALELTASKMKLPLGFIRGRYERGKRYVRKHCEDAPEFK